MTTRKFGEMTLGSMAVLFVLLTVAGAATVVPDPAAVKEVMAGKRTEANAAWWGFNAEDATDILQAAISSGAKKLTVPNMGKPWIVRPIQLESDQEIVFEKGVTVLAKKGQFGGRRDCLVAARGKKNITLTGPGAEFVMRKADYQKPPYKRSQWRHCLSLRGCSNVKVLGLRLASSGGDGIYVGSIYVDKGASGTKVAQGGSDVLIRDVHCDDNHRQAISVICARNLLIENSKLTNTSGTAPEYGIDFEPNRADEYLVNCVVRKCEMTGNKGAGFGVGVHKLTDKSEPVSIRFEDCVSKGNKYSMCLNDSAYGKDKPRPVSGTVDVVRCQLVGKKRMRRLNPETFKVKLRFDPK